MLVRIILYWFFRVLVGKKRVRKEGIGINFNELRKTTLTFYSAMITIKQLWQFKRAKILSDHIDDEQKRITLKVSYDNRFSPICGHCKNEIKVHQYERRMIRDIPLWDYSVFIESHYRKGYCPKCKKIVVEYLEYTSPGLRMTNRLANYIVELGRKMSDSDISRLLHMSWDVAHKVH